MTEIAEGNVHLKKAAFAITCCNQIHFFIWTPIIPEKGLPSWRTTS